MPDIHPPPWCIFFHQHFGYQIAALAAGRDYLVSCIWSNTSANHWRQCAKPLYSLHRRRENSAKVLAFAYGCFC